jgi:hypothetical protein
MALLHMLNLVESLEGFVEDGRTGLNIHRTVEALKCEFDLFANLFQWLMAFTVGFAARYAHSQAYTVARLTKLLGHVLVTKSLKVIGFVWLISRRRNMPNLF